MDVTKVTNPMDVVKASLPVKQQNNTPAEKVGSEPQPKPEGVENATKGRIVDVKV